MAKRSPSWAAYGTGQGKVTLQCECGWILSGTHDPRWAFAALSAHLRIPHEPLWPDYGEPRHAETEAEP